MINPLMLQLVQFVSLIAVMMNLFLSVFVCRILIGSFSSLADGKLRMLIKLFTLSNLSAVWYKAGGGVDPLKCKII